MVEVCITRLCVWMHSKNGAGITTFTACMGIARAWLLTGTSILINPGIGLLHLTIKAYKIKI